MPGNVLTFEINIVASGIILTVKLATNDKCSKLYPEGHAELMVGKKLYGTLDVLLEVSEPRPK